MCAELLSAQKTKQNKMKTYTKTKLNRTDRRPISFNGYLLVKDSTRSNSGSNQNRWTDCFLYETDSQKIVVGIGNVTCWSNERDFYRVDVFDKIEDAITHIEEHAASLTEDIVRQLKENHDIEVAERII